MECCVPFFFKQSFIYIIIQILYLHFMSKMIVMIYNTTAILIIEICAGNLLMFQQIKISFEIRLLIHQESLTTP